MSLVFTHVGIKRPMKCLLVMSGLAFIALPPLFLMPPDPGCRSDRIMDTNTAKLCAHFVSHLFASPDVPPPPAPAVPPSTTQTPQLEHFIAYALHRMRLHTSVTFAALYLLQCLKAHFPVAKGSSSHWLIISAFMLAPKIIYDDTYSNKSWCIVGQGMFALWEINQMEREMCSYLEWQLSVDPSTLRDFQAHV